MFERYTEKARRAIFFARYEASQYGHPYIETEHLLLGLWREDHALRTLLNDTGPESQIRTEIERRIVRRKRISTSVEVPLSADSKKVLHLAAEEADRLAHRHIGTEHVMLGILRVQGSLGAVIAEARGISLEDLREKLAKAPTLASAIGGLETNRMRAQHWKPSLPITTVCNLAQYALVEFLAGLKEHSADYLMSSFTHNAQMVDVYGKRWTREEISKDFVGLFAPYAKKNAAYLIEETLLDSNHGLVVIVLWKNALVASMERVWMHRMTVVLVPENDEWVILSIQATPVQPWTPLSRCPPSPHPVSLSY